MCFKDRSNWVAVPEVGCLAYAVLVSVASLWWIVDDKWTYFIKHPTTKVWLSRKAADLESERLPSMKVTPDLPRTTPISIHQVELHNLTNICMGYIEIIGS